MIPLIVYFWPRCFSEYIDGKGRQTKVLGSKKKKKRHSTVDVRTFS